MTTQRRGHPIWWREAEAFAVRIRYRLNVVRDPEDFLNDTEEDLDFLRVKAEVHRNETKKSTFDWSKE